MNYCKLQYRVHIIRILEVIVRYDHFFEQKVREVQVEPKKKEKSLKLALKSVETDNKE